ncbi:uncharacterized protein N7496_011072 [Penicillium cataractarum]|uniref:Aminoglycoside phosphotransferase domain-containing protein n=1 Tax=Penicillium cataractarum TaxID=2100454 RepID=A0A9W9UW02_9EURO|nr:uncharacterized protein N7496_011072 [Penicillium cataractarum]KAJ5358659.1 hypothetical protein N7496_011072 [Penicillium cataractarum]
MNPDGALAKGEIRFDSKLDGQCNGWILMTRFPGVPLSTLSLSTDKLKTIDEQLANIVFRWREGLPVWKVTGNLECGISDEKPSSLDSLEIFGLRIIPSSTMPAFGVKFDEPIINGLQYYRVKLEARLRKLQELEIFKGNRHLIHSIREFIAVRLPQLGICNLQSQFVFTRYDLSPHNVFISVDATEISGVFDFEFSGFFPELDEFVNDAVDNEGDWPDILYEAYLNRLEACGMRTPRRGIEERLWREATARSRLGGNIAPWWLEDLVPSERMELEEDVLKSEKIVLEAMQLLDQSVRDSIR